jgi:hypothetical protein
MEQTLAQRHDAGAVIKAASLAAGNLLATLTQPDAIETGTRQSGAADGNVLAGVRESTPPMPADRMAETLTPEEFAEQRKLWRPLRDLWAFTGRDEQQPPPGDWRTWLILGGRGSGKTRAGAEWVHAIASAGKTSDLRIALVAETLGDAREVMIDGISGICRIARRCRPEFEFRGAGWSGRMARWRRSSRRKIRKACAARSSTLPGATSSPNGSMVRRPGTCCNSASGSAPHHAAGDDDAAPGAAFEDADRGSRHE